ncbi:MAG: hypothetical protein COT06_12595 [Syntrophobacteraceae bacterium CG07_land_8_20_14_0_80_61_8]|nr:MAG: hypothetical protein COT06_12595 [Syntrophobacteraceae bacterium CG07_land_8_20_14_0_80_61_8]
MRTIWAGLDAQTQTIIIAVVAGVIGNLLQWIVTRWPAVAWLTDDSSNTRKRMVQLATVLVLAVMAGAWSQADTTQIVQIVVGAIGVNQAVFSMLKASVKCRVAGDE